MDWKRVIKRALDMGQANTQATTANNPLAVSTGKAAPQPLPGAAAGKPVKPVVPPKVASDATETNASSGEQLFTLEEAFSIFRDAQERINKSASAATYEELVQRAIALFSTKKE